jgi:hypothetical protein
LKIFLIYLNQNIKINYLAVREPPGFAEENELLKEEDMA